MTLPAGAYIEDGLIIYGEEAFRPHEWKPRRAYHRLTAEERAHYNREWMRRQRIVARAELIEAGRVLRLVSSLHDVKCTGPTRVRGCVCSKVPLFERVSDER